MVVVPHPDQAQHYAVNESAKHATDMSAHKTEHHHKPKTDYFQKAKKQIHAVVIQQTQMLEQQQQMKTQQNKNGSTALMRAAKSGGAHAEATMRALIDAPLRALMLLYIPNRVAAHGALYIPTPRNALDAELPDFEGGKSPLATCTCDNGNGGPTGPSKGCDMGLRSGFGTGFVSGTPACSPRAANRAAPRLGLQALLSGARRIRKSSAAARRAAIRLRR